MAAVSTDCQEFPIWIGFKGNNYPLVFDLSGAVPFELYLTIHRSAATEGVSRDIVLMKTDSVFDFPIALDKGLVELVDEATGQIVRHPPNNTDQAQTQQVASQPLIPSRALHFLSTSALFKLFHCMLQHIFTHWYGQSTSTTYDYVTSISAELPPSERKTLVSCGPLRSKAFTVVSEILMPPKLSISLSLGEIFHAPEGEDGTTSETSSLVIHITITNASTQCIILKTIGDQPHLKAPGEVTNPRSRVTADHPNLQNFSVVDQETQEDLISHPPLFTTPIAGGSRRSWPRKQFLALSPLERATRTAKLPGHRLVPSREYHVSLRPTGCWWTYGALDDLFGEGNAVFKRWPSAPSSHDAGKRRCNEILNNAVDIITGALQRESNWEKEAVMMMKKLKRYSSQKLLL
ncbi:hypothetical protein SLS62_003126 [Diatrype stigma]|uniref:Uncharacterized protein n=1 Tax=Diatrype stigma TaxID=117547 RepID=A0AAN9UWX1_9PEZI